MLTKPGFLYLISEHRSAIEGTYTYDVSRKTVAQMVNIAGVWSYKNSSTIKRLILWLSVYIYIVARGSVVK